METILELTDDAAAALGTEPLVVPRQARELMIPPPVQSSVDKLLSGES